MTELKSIKMPGNFPNNLKLNRTSTNNPLVSEEIKRKSIKRCELNVMKFIALRTYISKGKSQTHTPQLLSPWSLGPVLHNKKSHHHEKPMHVNQREAPTCHN